MTPYDEVLHRSADPQGKQIAANALSSGLSKHDLEVSLMESPEFNASHSDNTSFVTELYQDSLGRTPDSAGLNTWKSALDSGRSRDSVVRSFLDSDEAENDTIKSLFGHYLKRPVDDGGLQVYRNILRSNPHSEDFIAESIIASALAEYALRYNYNRA